MKERRRKSAVTIDAPLPPMLPEPLNSGLPAKALLGPKPPDLDVPKYGDVISTKWTPGPPDPPYPLEPPYQRGLLWWLCVAGLGSTVSDEPSTVGTSSIVVMNNTSGSIYRL